VKKLLLIVLTIIFCFALFWVGSIIRCEILTLQHGKEFVGLEESTNILAESESLKVLDYSDIYAQVYYVDREMGNILRFSKQKNQWKFDKWEETVWSKSGNADGFMWPYIR